MLTKVHAELISSALLLFVLIVQVSASSLEDYQQRISKAIAIVQQLQRAPNQSAAEASLTQLRAELPPKETVRLEKRSIAIDNAWLYETLNQFQKSKSQTVRKQLLASVNERLEAIKNRIDEQTKSEAARDSDTDKGHLAEILRRPEYNRTNATEESALSRLWSRFLRWILSLLPKSRPLQPGRARFLSAAAQIIVVVVSLALIIFFVWKFVPKYLRNRRDKKKPKREARIVLGERLEPDQTAADLLEQAEALARGGDLRAAIRKAYIGFLCELADRRVLSLAQYKTNRDYLNSVRERMSLYAAMRMLTDSFELHWYGSVPAQEHDWTEFRNGYQQALKASSF